jgi:hypothetical protein
MPVTIKVVVERRPAIPNASALAKLQATAAANHLRDALINGYYPDTMDARPRKGDGNAQGYDTGKLARGLQVKSAGSTRTEAAFAIVPSADRRMLGEPRPEYGGRSFVDKFRIITLDGAVQDVLAEAAAEYMRSLR